MYYILEFKEFDKKRILYLHGLDGELNEDYKDILNKLGVDYTGLSLDYREQNVWDMIYDLNVDGVIGHSLGGYMAFYLSNYKEIPALLLMPSFDKADIKLQDIPKDVLELPDFNKKIALIATEDEAVDQQLQRDSLEDIEIFEEEMNHDLTVHIFKKYAKIFLEKFFKYTVL